jgi:hypothetical protein
MVNSVVDGALPSSQEQAPAVFNGANPLAENTVPIFKNLASLQRELAGLFGPGSESKVSYPASNSMSLNPLVTAAVMGDALKLVGGGEFSSTTPTAGVPKLLSAGNLLNMVTGEQTPSPTGQSPTFSLAKIVDAGASVVRKVEEDIRQGKLQELKVKEKEVIAAMQRALQRGGSDKDFQAKLTSINAEIKTYEA